MLHHRNEDKTDNRYGNLELTTRPKHSRHFIADVCARSRRRLLAGREWSEVPA
ncbi:HNH endonuclease [Variovorax sp. M-6]|uniref:HNH endonuclease n=1 Tax=Variovorax sp. M-6 TaxID=3233041 RepID=UPI003F973795